ncbi:phosphoenolpyruvate carboxykinase [Candidatus Izemoplasma sp. B36]|uniref:phosphoenolpyruvate carboxykinase n=1 Tax=Candidatus Izemoplasma sp. B36 TaxID=3242468 RepID=UPI003556DC2E
MEKIRDIFINNKTILVNLTNYDSDNQFEIIESNEFNIILESFWDSNESQNNGYVTNLKEVFRNPSELLILLKYLVDNKFDNLIMKKNEFDYLVEHRKTIYMFVEKLFDYWRSFERYGIFVRDKMNVLLDNSVLVEKTNTFTQKILKLYRRLLSNISGKPIYVYRQTPGGLNSAFIVSKGNSKLPNEYSFLDNINVINAVMIRTPFIGHSESNSRSGLFKQIYTNPIKNINLTERHWLCYPIKIGKLIGYVYFHRELLHHGIALSNLFEPAFLEYNQGIKPDLIYVYGSHEIQNDKTFFIDEENDMCVGYVSRINENDYFGYMKKMILTLHNARMINEEKLPIHGAMVNIVLKNKKEYNIAITGDSGAGKSETLEALKIISKGIISEMNIIFDDMGIFFIKNNQIYANGTEIGAFVRLDDLDSGYAYRELDRAIYMNPERTNARVVLPVSEYDFIIKNHKVDYVFYANNYFDSKESIKYFSNINNAIKVFKEGKRKAKGTTSEKGIVKSYFANPFGCVQLLGKTEALINKTFNNLYKNEIPVGEIYTKLAVKGKETTGIISAAKAILMEISN